MSKSATSLGPMCCQQTGLLPPNYSSSWIVLTYKAFTLLNQKAAAAGRLPLQQLLLLAALEVKPDAASKCSSLNGLEQTTAERRDCTQKQRRVQGKLCCWWRSAPSPQHSAAPGASAPRVFIFLLISGLLCMLLSFSCQK